MAVREALRLGSGRIANAWLTVPFRDRIGYSRKCSSNFNLVMPISDGLLKNRRHFPEVIG